MGRTSDRETLDVRPEPSGVSECFNFRVGVIPTGAVFQAKRGLFRAMKLEEREVLQIVLKLSK
jgi:hypothetical protein